jgi:hypothetical protein
VVLLFWDYSFEEAVVLRAVLLETLLIYPPPSLGEEIMLHLNSTG